MNKIVQFIDKLSEIDTKNVDPLIYLTQEINATRKDVVSNELTQNLALKNGPKKDSDYFKSSKSYKSIITKFEFLALSNFINTVCSC